MCCNTHCGHCFTCASCDLHFCGLCLVLPHVQLELVKVCGQVRTVWAVPIYAFNPLGKYQEVCLNIAMS